MQTATIIAPPQLPPPLRTSSDMTSTWTDGDLSFDDAAERIVKAHEGDGAHRDLPVGDLKTWAVTAREGKFAVVPLARHHEPRVLRASAFSHLSAKLGAPADFIRRLPAPLQLATLNYLLLDRGVDASATTLRLRGDEIAALVSDRYAALDAPALIQTIRAGLLKYGVLNDVRVRSFASGLVDNMRLVFPAESVPVEVGDVSSVGLDITGSSFAKSAIHVTPVIWRLVCKNGMRAPERRGGMSFRHVGDPQRLRDGLAEAIPSALVYARGVMKQWESAVSFMVEDVQRQIDDLRELTIPERKGVENELQAETGSASLPTRARLYDLVNAMTAAAKSAAPARRLELESVAGHVLARHVGRA